MGTGHPRTGSSEQRDRHDVPATRPRSSRRGVPAPCRGRGEGRGQVFRSPGRSACGVRTSCGGCFGDSEHCEVATGRLVQDGDVGGVRRVRRPASGRPPQGHVHRRRLDASAANRRPRPTADQQNMAVIGVPDRLGRGRMRKAYWLSRGESDEERPDRLGPAGDRRSQGPGTWFVGRAASECDGKIGRGIPAAGVGLASRTAVRRRDAGHRRAGAGHRSSRRNRRTGCASATG